MDNFSGENIIYNLGVKIAIWGVDSEIVVVASTTLCLENRVGDKMVELTLVLGSTSDWKNNGNIREGVVEATRMHDDLAIRVEFASAHNTPEKVREVMGKSHVLLSGAGMSAALPGVMEACYSNRTCQVSVGVPLNDKLLGLPAFLSIAEMPPNNPVLCVGIDNVVGAMNIAYALEKGVNGIVLAKMGSVPEESYAKMKGKLEAVLGDAAADELKLLDVGELRYITSGKDGDKIPESVHGKLVIGVYHGTSPKNVGAFKELDRILAATGGVQILINDGLRSKDIAENALAYAREFDRLMATGTMAVGSPGYTNAAQFAAREMSAYAAPSWKEATGRVMEACKNKHDALMAAKGYVIEKGEVKQAD